MSALRSCAARKTLRPMRPKPLIPTRTGMSWNPSIALRTEGEQASGRLYARVGARSTSRCWISMKYRSSERKCAARCSAITTERWRPPVQPIATTRCALPSRDVLRQQVLEQRDHALVELLEPAVAPDVVDDPRVEAGQRAQLGLPVRVGQEAHVEREVGVARRAVLVAERA